MRIVFLGSGNIAHFFAPRLQKKGHEIVQIYSRNIEHAKALASICAAGPVTDRVEDIDADADAYVLAIKDDALSVVAQQISFPGKIVLHCAGAIPLDAIARVSAHCAVIWSLYSIKKNNLPQNGFVPLIVEANTPVAREAALTLANDISNKVLETDFPQRQILHLNAVLVNNFTNHLFAIAQKICEEQGLPFDILYPIMHQTIEQAQYVLPSESQTGPAVRHDEETIQKHLALLTAHPEWQKIYTDITNSIQQYPLLEQLKS